MGESAIMSAMKKMCVYLAVAASVGMLGVAPAASIDDLPSAAQGTPTSLRAPTSGR